MLQSLRGSKLPLRLLKSIYRRLLALLLHCVKHPIKTFLFIVKAYILLMLFALCLAFSVGSFAQEQIPEYTCPDGGTLNEYQGQMICSVPAPSGELYQFRYGSYMPTRQKACDSSAQGKGRAVVEAWGNPPRNGASLTGTWGILTNDGAYCEAWYSFQTVNSEGEIGNGQGVETDYTISKKTDSYCPDESYPELTSSYGSPPNLVCYAPATVEDLPPCDCSDLTGSNPQGINYFYAANGAYSQANPPNCISRDDNENGDIPSCNCKLIATKWSSADVNINGTIYQRWQPVPDQNGVTGVFTGGQCDESEKDTPPDTPEKCYQLGSGQNFCLEDPDQKCAKIDGIMTCEAGCGTVNGEFFCFENDDPEEPLPDPDDNITDPDTPLNDMVKRDFKDVLGGTESRLDILARLMSDIKTNTSKGDSELAAKQDATNRLLKEISDKLDEESDDETPTNPQPTYNTDKLEEFVNPNDWGEKNFRTVALAFKDRLLEAPVMQAVQGFFDVALSGSCPTWQTTVNMPFGGALNINIDQLCSETMNNIWPAIRAIIVLIFSFLAFRVAFTNE